MKHLIATLAVASFAFVSPAFAADVEHSKETTVDTSKNPITGTKTTTKTTTSKKKGAHGDAKMETTEKTKVYSDGSVEKSKEVEGESNQK